MIENEYLCDCGCGETVTVKSGGMLKHTVVMTPCTARAKRGITALQLSQSSVAELTPVHELHKAGSECTTCRPSGELAAFLHWSAQHGA